MSNDCVASQPRGADGEHSDDSSGVFDISNKERLGKTEAELVQTMIDGVRELIERERELEGVGDTSVSSP
jgi:protein-arginine kinase